MTGLSLGVALVKGTTGEGGRLEEAGLALVSQSGGQSPAYSGPQSLRYLSSLSCVPCSNADSSPLVLDSTLVP